MANQNHTSKARELLLEHGIKQLLLDKLNDTQINDIAAFALDHIQSSNLQHMIIQLASMEVRNRHGSAFLASNGVATIEQLKSLSIEQISLIADEYRSDKDYTNAIRSVRDAIIEAQQEQLAFHRGTDYASRGKATQYGEVEVRIGHTNSRK